MKLEFGATYYMGQTPLVYKGDVAGVKSFATPSGGTLGSVDPEASGITEQAVAPKAKETAK